MSRHKSLLVLVALVLAFSSLACSITLRAPRNETVEKRTFTIAEPLPEGAAPLHILIEMGAGELRMDSGSAQMLEGTIKYNVLNWEPSITRTADSIELLQNRTQSLNFNSGQVINEWDLLLGQHPFDLTLNAGAYQSRLKLGGLPITELRINDGASDSRVSFDEPNPLVMEKLSYKTGASNVTLEGLGNANFQSLTFEGGTGSYLLDFAGEMRQDANAQIKVGLSSVELRVPADRNCRVIVSGGMSNINPRGTWTISGTSYSIQGEGPLLEIKIEMGLGTLNLVAE